MSTASTTWNAATPAAAAWPNPTRPPVTARGLYRELLDAGLILRAECGALVLEGVPPPGSEPAIEVLHPLLVAVVTQKPVYEFLAGGRPHAVNLDKTLPRELVMFAAEEQPHWHRVTPAMRQSCPEAFTPHLTRN